MKGHVSFKVFLFETRFPVLPNGFHVCCISGSSFFFISIIIILCLLDLFVNGRFRLESVSSDGFSRLWLIVAVLSTPPGESVD